MWPFSQHSLTGTVLQSLMFNRLNNTLVTNPSLTEAKPISALTSIQILAIQPVLRKKTRLSQF